MWFYIATNKNDYIEIEADSLVEAVIRLISYNIQQHIEIPKEFDIKICA